jgi:N-acetyl-gamma-glutamyl-phosphate reductase
VRAGLLPADWPYVVHAVSGYSGGGKALIARFEDDTDIAWRGYGLAFGHKHVPEMKAYAGLSVAPLFSPAVVPALRGMVVEVPLSLEALPGVGIGKGEALYDALAASYAGSPIVSVSLGAPAEGEILMRRSTGSWDGLALSVIPSADGTQARLVARLDNLGKGASGAAVQSLNLMAGLPETAGLSL